MQEANIVLAIVVPDTAICKRMLYLSIACMSKLYKLSGTSFICNNCVPGHQHFIKTPSPLNYYQLHALESKTNLSLQIVCTEFAKVIVWKLSGTTEKVSIAASPYTPSAYWTLTWCMHNCSYSTAHRCD